MLHRGPARVTDPTEHSIGFRNRCLVLTCQADVVMCAAHTGSAFSETDPLNVVNTFVNAVAHGLVCWIIVWQKFGHLAHCAAAVIGCCCVFFSSSSLPHRDTTAL